MNKNIVFLSLILLSYGSAQTQLGCMANSHELKQKYDSKEYHYVQCNCPCDTHAAHGKKTQDRNQCIECLHFHDPKPLYVVSGYTPDRLRRARSSMPTHDEWLHMLMRRAKIRSAY